MSKKLFDIHRKCNVDLQQRNCRLVSKCKKIYYFDQVRKIIAAACLPPNLQISRKFVDFHQNYIMLLCRYFLF